MKIHLTGIGGVGMAGLAVLLKRRGHEVSGCDLKPTARTRWLESLGIPVAIGHDAKHVEGQDLVVVTPAVAKDNPEYVAARKILRRGEVLAKLVSDAPDSIAVCGSHGKTTTATFIAKLLIALGENVEWAIGGETGDFPVAGCVGDARTASVGAFPRNAPEKAKRIDSDRCSSRNCTHGEADHTVLVVEADESDGTLAEYAAKTLVVTNCEYDHPDHFRTRADYVACYDAARAKAGEVIEGGEVAKWRSDDTVSSVGAFPRNAPKEERDCPRKDCGAPDLASLLAALASHNRRNALMAAEVARRRGHSPDAIAAALPAVVSALPDRRFQRVWPTGEDEREDVSFGEAQDVRRESRDASGDLRLKTKDEVSRLTSDSSRLMFPVSRPQPLVYTDYAHHPTEMACAVQMARAAAKGRVIVLFQPHRYSRTKALAKEFPAAFAGADEVVLCPTYAAFEQPVEGGDVADLYAACRAATLPVDAASTGAPRFYLARSCAEAWEHARNTMQSGDLTLLLGAGDIIDLVPTVRADLSSRGCNSANCTAEERVSVSDAHFTEMRPRESCLVGTMRPRESRLVGTMRPRGSRRIWIGAGTNTWKSDLNLDVEYVKTNGPAGRPGATLLADPAIGPRIPWMAGIPGTIGGWIKMNAGAFGHSISEVIESVKIDGRWIPAVDCGFAYRHSEIKGEIQDVRFVGATAEGTVGAFPRNAPKENDREIPLRCVSRKCTHGEDGDSPQCYLARRKKFPPGTKGSVFKNPPGDHAGRLLELAGAKELRVGGAYVWHEHANVIVAGPDATPSDFLALARLMAARVRTRFGVELEPEVRGLVTVA